MTTTFLLRQSQESSISNRFERCAERASVIKPRTRYCLDTGPLFDHLLLSFFGGKVESIPSGLEKKLLHLSDPFLWEQFKKHLHRSKALVTCSGVLVEVDKHFRLSGPNKELRPRFREFVQKQVKEELKIEESPVRWEQLDTGELMRFGPVDSALLVVLRREHEMTLVTEDERLHRWCLERRLSCLHVYELLRDAT